MKRVPVSFFVVGVSSSSSQDLGAVLDGISHQVFNNPDLSGHSHSSKIEVTLGGGSLGGFLNLVGNHGGELVEDILKVKALLRFNW